MGKPLLVFALAQESQEVFRNYDVLHCGVGKVNAGYALTKRLHAERPSVIVNLGTAGSRKHKAGTIVNCTSFVQRDMDVTALGFEKYQTPFSDAPVTIEYGRKIDGLPQGVCGSGDNFASGADSAAFDAVDMEAYALAFISSREGIPFLCLKYISDGADESAHKDWHEALHDTAEKLREALERIRL
jgi:adenosylhomocysteine nucleosidase